MIILYIGSQGNGRKNIAVGQLEFPGLPDSGCVGTGLGSGPSLTGQGPVSTHEEMVHQPEPPRLQDAFASKFWSMLDAIARTLLWSGTEPFGVSLSTNVGSNWAIAEPAVSGSIPALAASALT